MFLAQSSQYFPIFWMTGFLFHATRIWLFYRTHVLVKDIKNCFGKVCFAMTNILFLLFQGGNGPSRWTEGSAQKIAQRLPKFSVVEKGFPGTKNAVLLQTRKRKLISCFYYYF